jgi:pyruvate/2-oxoglutarate dehydrogenase complex dihydrolipoamide acyltransferase (E2) component
VLLEIVMPKYGPNMLEGVLVRWLKRVGDRVEKENELAEIETEKVTAVVQVPQSGVLVEILVAEGDEVPVGAPIARIEVA